MRVEGGGEAVMMECLSTASEGAVEEVGTGEVEEILIENTIKGPNRALQCIIL